MGDRLKFLYSYEICWTIFFNPRLLSLRLKFFKLLWTFIKSLYTTVVTLLKTKLLYINDSRMCVCIYVSIGFRLWLTSSSQHYSVNRYSLENRHAPESNWFSDQLWILEIEPTNFKGIKITIKHLKCPLVG